MSRYLVYVTFITERCYEVSAESPEEAEAFWMENDEYETIVEDMPEVCAVVPLEGQDAT